MLDLHDASGSRQVLCWLQDGHHDVPAELDIAPSAAGTADALPSMRGQASHERASATTDGKDFL